ncbi:MAG TPA: M20/M25/M40 family metallo-hydrolase [Solirubrobacteraceae bacterium]|jgi:acetylornithine deacetylase/succinyl-diaminopimelate desuccinylase-like protein
MGGYPHAGGSTPEGGLPGAEPDGGGELAADAQELLQRLIRFDTVNPPGNERAAIEYLRGVLSDAGFQCELLAAEHERPNLVARLRPAAASGGAGAEGAGGAGGEGPTLCYLGHVDTVLADAREWRRDPWSGDLAEGCIWGRGSLDMKSQVAAEVAAATHLARGGWRPARGELLIVAVVDEETGGEKGAKWLTETHPEKVRCDMLLNEGGGPHFELDGSRYYGVCCAEKGVFRFTVTTDGTAGHASMPKMGENALLKMAPVLERFAMRQPALDPTAEPLAFLRGIGEDEHDPAAALQRLGERDARWPVMFEPMFGVTFAPTKASASEKINVIPSKAELRVDCRVPPGLGEEETRSAIDQVLGGIEGLRIEFTEQVTGNRSPVDSPLMDALGRWISEHDPGAKTVPTILPGFTDSRHFRAAFPDCTAYGFFPQRHQGLLETQALIHAPDERIDVRDLAFATEFYRALAVELLG